MAFSLGSIMATWSVQAVQLIGRRYSFLRFSKLGLSQADVLGYGCNLTGHSSRARFVLSTKCIVGGVVSAPGLRVAGRLNSGVRPAEKHMLDRKQAEAAAEVLMSKPQAAQDAARHDNVMARRVAIQRRAGAWGLVGMLGGSAIGHFAFGTWFPSAMVGFAVGAVIGRWVIGRQA